LPSIRQGPGGRARSPCIGLSIPTMHHNSAGHEIEVSQ